jgi:hypothetical protein
MATATGLSDELARVLIYEYHDTYGTVYERLVGRKRPHQLSAGGQRAALKKLAATFPQLFDRIRSTVPQYLA